jgi:hypothetical protein
MRLDRVTPRWISQIQYVSEDGIKKQNDQIRKAMRALFLSMKYMREQTNDAAEIVSKKIGWSPEAVLAAHTISGSLMSHDGTVSMAALHSMQDTLLEHGVIKKKLPGRGAHRPATSLRSRSVDDPGVGARRAVAAGARSRPRPAVRRQQAQPHVHDRPAFVRSGLLSADKSVFVEILLSVAVPP